MTASTFIPYQTKHAHPSFLNTDLAASATINTRLEWQGIVERKIFSTIHLTPARMAYFQQILSPYLRDYGHHLASRSGKMTYAQQQITSYRDTNHPKLSVSQDIYLQLRPSSTSPARQGYQLTALSTARSNHKSNLVKDPAIKPNLARIMIQSNCRSQILNLRRSKRSG